MINTNRVVPVEKIDLISLYGLILQQSESTLAKVSAATVDGQYSITAAATPLIADQPVQSMDFASGVSTATVYFVAGLNFTGFTINGAAVTPTGTVNADGVTLYKAELGSGAITITQVGF